MQRLSISSVFASMLAILVSFTYVMITIPVASATSGTGSAHGAPETVVATSPRHAEQERHPEPLSLIATSPSVPAGATVPVVATVSNQGDSVVNGTITAAVPEGWQARPETAEIEHLDQGEERIAVFEVTVPAGTDPANYPVSFVATTPEGSVTAVAHVPVDPIPVTVTAVSDEATDLGHHKEYLTDEYISTKWFTNNPTGWAQLQLTEPVAVTRYSLTSADDFPDRDPRTWTLSGSNDGGETWTVLDSRTGEVFPGRFHTNTYRFENTVAYRDYRIDFTENNDGPALQLAEVTLNTLPTATS